MFSARNRTSFRRAKRRFIRKTGLRRRRPVGRRRSTRRKVKVGRVPMIYKSIAGGFPKSITVKLKYFDQVTLENPNFPIPDINAGGIYRANSVWDPLYSITGPGNVTANLHPLYSGVYNQYIVLSSKITMAPILQTDAAANNVAYFGLIRHIDTDPTAQTFNSVQEMFTQPSTNVTPPKICGSFIAQGFYPGRHTKAVMSFNASKDFGHVNVMDDPQLRAWWNKNPTRTTYFTPFICGTTTAATGRSFMITIEYVVQYSLLKNDVDNNTLMGDDPNNQIYGVHRTNAGATGPASIEAPWSQPVYVDTVYPFLTNGAGDRIIMNPNAGTTLGV